MQTVYTGRSIVGGHDGSEQSLTLVRRTTLKIGYGYILLVPGSSAKSMLLPSFVVCVVDPSLRPALASITPGRIDRLARSARPQRVLLGKLVDEITGVAPERKVGARRVGGVGGPSAAMEALPLLVKGCLSGLRARMT